MHDCKRVIGIIKFSKKHGVFKHGLHATPCKMVTEYVCWQGYNNAHFHADSQGIMQSKKYLKFHTLIISTNWSTPLSPGKIGCPSNSSANTQPADHTSKEGKVEDRERYQ